VANDPTISIVIPTRNRRALLAETIASVLAQTFANWELIVVDDASEDDTFSYVSRFEDKRIKVIRLAQQAERSAARNTGLDLAKGEFILFFDDDDLLPEAGLQTHIDAFGRYPSAIASVGSYVQFDERGAHQTVKFVRRRCEHNLWPDILMGWSPACGRCLFRTSAVKAAEGWNATYNICEDHELWLRLSRVGPAVLLPDIAYMYRVHGGQWRPPRLQTRKLLTRMRERAVQQMHGNERQLAERILAARKQRRLATDQYRNAENFRALFSYLKAVRMFPGMLGSPLMRPLLFRRIRRCLAGGKPVVDWWWRVTKRKNIHSTRSIVRSADGRTHLGREAPAFVQSEEDD